MKFKTDPFTEFLNGCTPALVETERLGNFITARRESFGHAAHRQLLANISLERHRFQIMQAANRAHLYRQELETKASNK